MSRKETPGMRYGNSSGSAGPEVCGLSVLRPARPGPRLKLAATSRAGLGLAASVWIALFWIALFWVAPPLRAQAGCTTQANMTLTVRNGLADAALALANAVQSDDAARVQGQTIAPFAVNFSSTANLIHTTAGALQGDTLRVTQVYELNASNRKPGDTSDAEFTCALTGTTSETDFSIPALPPGTFGFGIVEAGGARPWLLAFLLQQEGSQWKMAGFYPHARTAAGHDGLWYWRAARAAAKNRQLWLAWLLYSEAGDLLRPTLFVSSTNLDLLQSEQRTAVPPELSGGIGPETPLVVKGNAGSAAGNGGTDMSEFHFTGISTSGSEDGKSLDLMLHLRLSAGTDPAAPNPAAAKARNTAAAAALLDAHKELRQDFTNVWVFAESAGQNAFVTEQSVNDIP